VSESQDLASCSWHANKSQMCSKWGNYPISLEGYIYICMYIYIYIHYIYTHIYMYIYVCAPTHMQVMILEENLYVLESMRKFIFTFKDF
jgi:hypothetical protein